MDSYFGETAPLVDLEALADWILVEDDEVLVVNKPGWLVCHPSKNGPRSSLVGAVREYSGIEKLHLVARLDRETSGLVVFAKRPAAARKYQTALQGQRVTKCYFALLEHALEVPVTVDRSIARRPGGPVFVKSEVREDRTAKTAVTRFLPLISRSGYTLCRVEPETGRKHQIRVHASWLGHPVVGDKIYGPDERLYIEFIESGFTPRLAAALPLKRQALHCAYYRFQWGDTQRAFEAPLQPDLVDFMEHTMGLERAEIERLTRFGLDSRASGFVNGNNEPQGT